MKKMIMCRGGGLSVQGSGYPPVTRDSSDFVPQTHFVPPKTHFHDIFVRGGRKNSLLRGWEYKKAFPLLLNLFRFINFSHAECNEIIMQCPHGQKSRGRRVLQ